MTCPDDCVDGIIEMIDAADSTIELSLQYLDLDWYWGFGDNPIIEAILPSSPKRSTSPLTIEWLLCRQSMMKLEMR